MDIGSVVLGAGAGMLAVVQLIVLKRFETALKRQQDTREKAAIVAELMAEWIAVPEDLSRLNRLSFQAFLWLPEPLAVELSKRLNHDPEAIPARELLLAVRRHLLDPKDKLDAKRIIVFEKP